MIIDTHCHLYLPEFSADINEVIKRAEAEQVGRFYLPAIDNESHTHLIKLEEQFPGRCYAMMGLHPCSVKEDYEKELNIVKEWLEKRKFAAIGETGLDFYWDKTFQQQQYDALEKQCLLAIQYNLPIVLHTRNATRETIDVVKKHIPNGLKGIFHCFGGNASEAKEVAAMGFYLGIGGVVTYKNSGLAEIVKETELKYIVLETDAPYLTPAPYRGKRNESSYLKFVVDKIAAIKDIPRDEVISVTTANAEKVFSA